jgi:hypothetical protein
MKKHRARKWMPSDFTVGLIVGAALNAFAYMILRLAETVWMCV